MKYELFVDQGIMGDMNRDIVNVENMALVIFTTIFENSGPEPCPWWLCALNDTILLAVPGH